MKLCDRSPMTVQELRIKLENVPDDYTVWAMVKGPMRGRVGEKVGGGANGVIKQVAINHPESCVDLIGVEPI